MTAQLGNAAKLYLSTASISGPTWTEMTIVEEDTVNSERNAAEIANRSSDDVKVLIGKRKMSLEVTGTYVKGNAVWETLRDAHHNGTMVAVAAMTGTVTASGEEGMQADCRVVSLNHARPLQEGCKFTATLRPDAASTQEPVWTEI